MLLFGEAHTLRRRSVASALLVLGLLPVTLGGSPASAQLFDPFVPPAFSVNQAGAIDIIGNGLLTCGTSTACQETLAGTRNSGNGSFTMVDLDADDGVLPAAASDQTFRSSSAMFTPPAGSTVLYAGLYWSGQTNNANRNQMKLLVPGDTTYTTVTGAVDSSGSLYQGRADVTALVQAAGPGEYWGADVQGRAGRNTYAAWSMVVVYGNPALPVRNLSVFEGFGRVSSNFRQLDVPVTGFLTPPFGDVNAEIGVVAYEGDRNIGGDQVRIDVDATAGTNFQNLTDVANPTTNFGNGSISDGGVTQTGSTPNNVNNLNIDIDEFTTVNTLQNGQTDTTIRFQTTGDFWYPGALTFQVDLFVPEFPEVTKTVVDRNGGDALPGDILDYTVTFTNTGNDGAENSIVRDVIPDDTTFVPGSITVANGNGSFDGTQIVAAIGDGPGTPATGGFIEPGEVAEIRFAVTVDASARGTDIENEATLSYDAQTLQEPFTFITNETVTPVPPLAELSITKSTTPDPVASGENVTSTIVVTNNGPNTATGVELQDTLTNSTFVSSDVASCAGTTTINCTLPDIASGDSQTITIVASTDVALADGAAVANTASVSADQEDDDLTNNSATAQVQADPVADLSIAKADDIDPARPGDTVTYTVTVTNNGPSVAHDVAISDSAPAGLTITNVDVPGVAAVTCNQAANQCIVPTLAANGTVDMVVTAIVADTASGTLTNAASVQSADPDPTTGDNSTTETTLIEPLADVSVAKDTDPSGVALVAGTDVTYTVQVSNAGPSTATDVTVNDTLPAGLTLVSASSAQGSCTGTTAISCDIGSIAAGTTVPVTITATVGADQNGATITNTATVTTSTDEPVGGGNPNSASTTDTITNSSDLRQQKTVSENPIIAGTSFAYTLTTFNDGPSDSSGTITVTDTVPANITIDSAPGCVISGQTVTCTSTAPITNGGAPLVFTVNASVPAAAAANPTVQNTATVTYTGTDPNVGNNTAIAETELIDEADVRIDKEWATATAEAGGQATFTLTVTNDGPSVATSVQIDDQLPGGLTVASAGGPGVTCDLAVSSAVDCSLDSDLALNGTAVVTVVADIPADADAGQLNNTGSVSSATGDRNPSNNDDVDSITIERNADLTVTKVATDVTPIAGETAEYTIVVTNNGPASARNTVVGDAPPAGLTLAGTPTAAPAGTCTGTGGAISCDLGTLQPGAANAVTITYSATVDAALAPGTQLTNTASAGTTDVDPSPATVDEVITIDTETDLAVVKTASIDPATPGAPLTYTVTVSNNGPSDALAVELNDPLPAGFTANSITSTIGTCTVAGLCTIGRIPANGSAIITMVGEVAPGAAGATLENTTDAVTSSTPLINTGDDSGSVTVALAPSADVSVAKSANPTTIDAGGGQVVFTIVVANAGPSDATSVEVTDTLPVGFVVDSTTASAGTCASDTSCQLGTIAAGDSATVTVVGHFPSTADAGTTTNTASVTTATPTPTPGPFVDTADVDITQSADVRVSKSGPVSVTAGGTGVLNNGTAQAVYSIAVQNPGPSAAQDVVLSDVLDPAVLDATNATATVVPASACTPVNNSGTIECDIGTLDVGALVTLEIRAGVRADAPAGAGNLVNTATVATSTTDDDPSNNTSTVETDVTINSDLAVVKTDPAQFRAGEAADYTIVVTNNGPSDATGVEVADLPAGIVTFGAVTSVPDVCSSLPCAVGDLAVGDSITITVPATVDDDVNNTVVANTATVSSATPDLTSGNDTSTVTTGIVRRADMEVVSKIGAPASVSAGEVIEYTIVGRNNGPSVARDATLIDTIPVGTTLLPASLPAGCTSTGNVAGETVTCELGDLSASDSETRIFSVIVNPDVADGTMISNTANAQSDTTDDVPGNDSETATNDVVAVADVSVTKTVAPAPLVPGSLATYTITVDNAGPSNATGVEVTDDISAIFEGGVATTAGGAGITCDLTVSCDPFDLPVGSTTITVTGTLLASQTTDVSNTVSVTTTSTDPVAPNDSQTITTPVSASADLVITKVDDVAPGTVDPTGAITYTIEVTNNGPSDAQTVSIADTIPADVTVTSITSSPAGCTAFPCDFATLASGDTATVTVVGTVSDRAVGTISNTASVTSATPDPTPGGETVTLPTPVTPVADLGVTKVLNTTPLVPGLPARYTIVVTNNGPAVAEDVEIDELLPAGVSFTSISSPIGTCGAPTGAGPATAGTVNCQLGDLNDQASVTIDVEVLVDAATTADLANSVTATTTTQEPTGPGALPNTATTNSPVTVSPDLRTQKVLTDADLVAGAAYEYVITVFNDGPSVASGTMTLTDQLPAQIEPAAADVTIAGANGGDCSYQEAGGAQDRLISCTFNDDIVVGGSLSFTVSGTIQPGVVGSIDDNTATVSTVDSDPNPANDSGTATANLATDADLTATKTFDAASVIAGETTTFTMSVTNDGPSTAVNAVVTDLLPAGLSFVSFTPTPATAVCTVTPVGAQQQLSCVIASLAPSSTLSVDVTLAVGPDYAAGPYSNTATASSDTPDGNPSNNNGVDDIEIIREADLSITKTAGSPNVTAGETISYTIAYRNDGPSSAEASFIGDQLPVGMTFVAPLPAGCTEASGILNCDLGLIAPMAPADADLSFTYTVMIDEGVADTTMLSNSATISSITPPPGGVTPPPSTAVVTVDTSADVELLSKDATPDPVRAGENVTYTLVARNNGPSTATNLTIVDDLPVGITPTTPLPSGCSIIGGDLSCNLGDVLDGDSVTLTFEATVDADVTATTITNTAAVSADPSDPTPGNESQTEPVAVVAEADIAITKVASPDPAVPGEAITYSIVATNAGPSDAQAVFINDPAPTDITVTSASAPGASCTLAVSCDIGVLAAGDSVTLTVVGDVASTATAPIVNTADVTSTTPASPTGPPRTVEITTPISPIADISVTKAVSPTAPVPGAAVQYTIEVTNAGPSAAQNVVATDTLDAALTNLATSTTGCSITGQDVSCTFPTLAPGTQTIVVTADLDEAFTGTLSNGVTVTTDTPEDPASPPNTATVDAPVAPEADVSIVKTAAPDPAVAGEALTYTLVVTNNGPSTATDVSVTDDVPAGFDLGDVTSTPTGCLSVDSGSPCVIPTLAVGATETITINGTIEADVTDLPANTADVTAATTDSTPGNNASSADPVVNESASVTTTKVLTVPASGTVVPGESVTWEITVANNGPSDALDVIVDDSVPAILTGVTISSVATPAGPPACTAFPCTLGTLEPAQSVLITVSGEVPSGTPAGDLVNAAATSSSTPDPIPTDNNPTATNPIVPSADVSIVKTGPAGDVTPGTTVSYLLTVTNDGPSDADDIAVTDTIPAAFDESTLAVASPTATCAFTGFDLGCTQALLADQGTIAITITGTVRPDYTGGPIDNSAAVASATPDPDPVDNTSSVSNTPVPDADLGITKTLTVPATGTPVPGTSVAWDIVVSNPGPSDSFNVEVVDTVDAAVTNLATSTPGCSFTGQDLGCVFATLAAGDDITVTVTGDLASSFTGSLDNTASVTTDTGQGADTNPNDATSGNPTAPSAELTITKTATPEPVVPGGPITYEITVNNAGPSDATAATITDTIPADVTVTDITSTGGGVCANTGTCDYASIAANTSVVMTVTGTVSTDAVGTIDNSAEITSPTPDPTPNDHVATTTSDVTPYADLAVVKTLVTPATGPVAGTPARYSIQVTNDGPATAAAATIVDTLPTGTSFVSASTPFGSCVESGGVLTCALGDIPDGADFAVLVDLDVADDRFEPLVNSVTISSPTFDPNTPAAGTPGSNTSTTTSPVQVIADLDVQKSLQQTAVTAGQPFTYDIVITNNGPSTAVETITLSDPLPSQADLGTVVITPAGDCALTGGTVDCSFAADLAANTSITVTVSGTAQSGATSFDDNTATVGTIDDPAVDQSDPNPGNNVATASVNLAIDADLVASKSFADAAVTAGSTTVVTISVLNDGPSDATDVTLDDALPAGMTVESFLVTGGTNPACVAPNGSTTVACTADRLTPGQTLSVDVTVLVDANAPAGPLSNTVTAGSAVADRNPTTNTATDGIDVERSADLRITKASNVPTQNAGDDVDFTITVTNLGPSTAEASVLGDALPAGMSIDPGSILVDGGAAPQCSVPGGALVCDLGLLAPSPTPLTVTYSVTIDPDVASGSTLTNSAQVSSPTPLPDPNDPPRAEVPVDVTGSADLEVVDKTVDPTSPIAGETAEYTVRVRNNGPSNALGATITDALPTGVTLDESSLLTGCTYDAGVGPNGTITCALGDLAPVIAPAVNQTITYTVEVDADQTIGTTLTNSVDSASATPDPTPGNNGGSADITVDTEADLSITKVAVGAAPVVFIPGETIEWLITITNDGPSDAASVTVADTLDPTLTNVTLVPSNGPTCVSFPCVLGVVASGETVTIAVSADLPADTAFTSLDNTATVTSSTDDPNGPNTSTSTTPVTPAADVQISKSATPTSFVPGEPVTYTIDLFNAGPSDAQNIEFNDVLPAALDLSTVTINEGSLTCTTTPLTDRDVNCALATLADQATASVTITGTVLPTVTSAVANTVTMTTGTDDPMLGNNSSSITSPVAPVADIGVVKSIVTNPIVPGEPVEFSIVVTNSGPSAAQNVVVTDTVPAEYSGISSATPGCSINGNVVTCDLMDVAPGTSTITITGDLSSSHVGPTSNAARLTTTTTETGSLPNVATATGTAAPSADLAVTKTATPDPVTAGENVTYLIEVDNLGPSDALDVSVADLLPAGLTLVSVTPSQGSCTALPCGLGTIADASSATVTVVATLDSAALTIGTNTATVSSSTPDPTSGNDSDDATPAVQTRADLITTKVLTTPTAVPGEPLRWIITVTNPGPSDALDVSVADTVTSDVTNVVVSSSQGGCATFPCDLGTVAAGGIATVTIDADVPSSIVSNTIENQTTTTSSTPDGTPLDNNPIASNPIAPAADLRIAKVGPTTDAVAGTAVQWTITVDNDGPSDSRDVVITDDLPAAVDPATVSATSATATCGNTGLAVECTQAVIANGDTVTITIDAVLRTDFVGPIDNTATVESLLTTDLDPLDNTATSNTPNTPLAEVSITGSVVPSAVAAGTDVAFTFDIVNDGPSNAADTVVTIPLPASISVVGTPTLVGAPAGATVTVVNGEVIVDLGSLPPGTPVTVSFSGTVSPDQPAGPLDVAARTTTTTNQTDTTNDDTSVTVDVITDVALSITKTSDVTELRLGQDIEFTLTITNDGTSTSTAATIVDDVPASLSVVSVSDIENTCGIAGNTVTCANPTIAPNGGTYSVVITASATGNGADQNVASVVAASGGQAVASAPVDFVIERVSALSVVKSADRTSVPQGGTIVYSITVRNDGPDDAVGVTVRDQLPSGVGFVSATPTVGTYDEARGEWTIGDLADGASETLTITVTALTAGSITNTATVDSDVTDPPAGNADSATVEVVASVIPATGQDSSRPVPIGVGLVALGLLLLVVARRRRSSQPGLPAAAK